MNNVTSGGRLAQLHSCASQAIFWDKRSSATIRAINKRLPISCKAHGTGRDQQGSFSLCFLAGSTERVCVHFYRDGGLQISQYGSGCCRLARRSDRMDWFTHLGKCCARDRAFAQAYKLAPDQILRCLFKEIAINKFLITVGETVRIREQPLAGRRLIRESMNGIRCRLLMRTDRPHVMA